MSSKRDALPSRARLHKPTPAGERDHDPPTMQRARRDACRTVLVALAAPWVAPTKAAEPGAAPLRLSVALGPAFALGKAARAWAQGIADATGGATQAKVFAGATLAGRDPRAELASLLNGDADLAVGSTLFWAVGAPPLAVASLPWIAPTAHQLASLASGEVGERLQGAVEAAGAVPLALAPLPHRELATRTDRVHVPADLDGLRVRVADSALLQDLYAGLGARPAIESTAQARAALAAGTLDAQEGTPLAMVAGRLVAAGLPYVTVWGAVGELAAFAANRRAWEAWSSAQRETVRAAARAAAAELASIAPQESDSALEALRQSGATITRLLPAAQAGFAAAARPVITAWSARIGTELVAAAESASRAAAP